MATLRRAATLLEGLVAGLILSVVIAGLYSLWGVAFDRIQRSGETIEASQLARAELERAKVFGPWNLPYGVYNLTTETGSWSGAYDPAANGGLGAWVAGGSAVFDIAGTRLPNASTPGARFVVDLATLDSDVLWDGGASYSVDGRSRRAVIATVRRLPGGAIAFQTGSNMVVGGL